MEKLAMKQYAQNIAKVSIFYLLFSDRANITIITIQCYILICHKL